jgi:nucleotide-binding universal stress UspA family protein
LFTAIVAMAVVTTMAMPPMLRFAFSRLPMSEEERARLEREDFEARAFLPRVERLLVAVDDSASGRFASHLAGLLAAARRTPTTVLHLDPKRVGVERQARHAERSGALVEAAAVAGAEASAAAGLSPPAGATDPVDVTMRTGASDRAQSAIAAEAHKGYGLLLIGSEPAAIGSGFAPQITRTAQGFPGPFAIAIARAQLRKSAAAPLHVLVTVSGTRVSRQGAEVAIALAQASRGSVTALHVGASRAGPVWRLRFGEALAPRGYADAVVREITEMGEHYGIEVRGAIRQSGSVRNAVLRELAREPHNLLVMGVSPRPGDQLFLGELAAEMLARAATSLLFVCAEPVPGAEAQAPPPTASP